ncbi:MAG: prenyltransferase [Cytophagaceae bacterium]|nr:prenyltransferase [Cytophagaceae bacterium]|tara:strand:- start:7543 stop:8421 length:879 start_codon:yes stop_codon:yes gene_type:complete
MIIATQCIIHYGFLISLGMPHALGHFQFTILVTASVLIAAAGYIINDINDVEIDRINRPKRLYITRYFSEKKALNLYMILNIVGVALGFLLCNMINKPGFALLFVLISALLYTYASFVKKIIVVGHILISILVASSIGVVMVFDIAPMYAYHHMVLATPLSVLRDYALFAFLLNFLREIVKSIEDIEGDKNGGVMSLPIIMGRKRASRLASILALAYIAILIGYIYIFLYANLFCVIYLLLAICFPLLFFSVKSWSASSKHEFSRLSTIIKVVMLAGVLSLGILTLTLTYAA